MLNKKLTKYINKILKYYNIKIISIKDDLNLNNYLKPIDKIELIMILEDKFNITIRDDQANILIDKPILKPIDIKDFLKQFNIVDIKDERKEKLTKLNTNEPI